MMIREFDKRREGNYPITEHFKVSEFACKDGSNKLKVDIEGVIMLEEGRQIIKRPITVVSGYRTAEYNKQCGGAENSYHLNGQAFDIKAEGIEPLKLGIIMASVGFKGIIIYKDFVHVDTREDFYVDDRR